MSGQGQSLPPYGRTNTSQARAYAAAEAKNRSSTGVSPYASYMTPQARLASVTGLANSYGAKLAQGNSRHHRSRKASRKSRRQSRRH
jgi:hypothetical protein